MRRFVYINVLLLLVCASAWSLEPKWTRYSAISPDGSQIAFSFAGDLYVVAADGGLARPLTSSDGHEMAPVWSRDGNFLAFASDRHGNYDVYIMAAKGGPTTRLTHHSADDFPKAFSAKDAEVLFTSVRQDHHESIQFPSRRHPELYLVPRNGGRARLFNSVSTENAVFDSSGRYLLYEYKRGIENSFRKHHTSEAARDIWLWDTKKDSYKKVTNYKGEDRNPLFSPDGQYMYFLSESNGTQNVFKKALHESKRSSVEQLTNFDVHPVRYLTMANDGTLAFGYHGAIYTLKEGQEPQKVLIDIQLDSLSQPLFEQSIAREIDQFAVSPSGKEVAFIVRGEVFAASVAEGTMHRITETPEQERTVSFSPDGRKLLYAAERDGSWNLYENALVHEDESYFFNATELKETLLLNNGEETFQPQYSPDGKEVAFLENRSQLRVINLESKEVRNVGSFTKHFSYSDGDQHFTWSPDSQWLLLEFIHHSQWSGEVGLIKADGTGDYINLSKSGFNDSSAQFVQDGKQIIWLSSRDGMRDFASTGSTQSDVYSVFLTEAAWDRFNLSEEELALFEEREAETKKEAKKSEDKKDEDKKEDKEEDKEEKNKPMEIDWDGLDDRQARLTIHSAEIAGAMLTKDGKKLLYLAKFEKGFNLWITDLYTKETKILANLDAREASLIAGPKGEKAYVLADGGLRVITIEGGKAKPISIRGSFRVDRMAERAHVFEHVWRQVRERFYTEDLHGAAWDSLKPDYEVVLPHITHSYDFAEFLSELLGELNASHTGSRDYSAADAADATAAIGVFYDYEHDEAGLKIASVIEGGPIDEVTPAIPVGTIITAINGKTIAANEHIFKHLNNAAGKPTRLTLQQPKAKETRDVVIKPISLREEAAQIYERWVEGRRKATQKMSDGKVGYVHVRNMSDASYRTVFEQVYGEAVDAQALVVDTRFNGGGDLVDDLSTFLSGESYMLFETRDGRIIGSEPMRKWRKPSVVLMSEGNYSDAHCFPFAYKFKKLGKLVGTQVAGTCTFVWWERTIDPDIIFGIPQLAVNDPEGNALENQDLDPDIYVQNMPTDIQAGKDAQLEKGVEVMLEAIKQ